ncbi:MAG TPA: 4Fe-4S cluster-binding domain-containing protein [Candidatus Enterosoma merdigallinarum]|nr:4Fe-4S cluster-binding domain-containing protein [Candidatus Enterosoma merdigallinarum]
MRLAGFAEESIVDGPGVRIVVFFQGCIHHCPFCQNPTTWPFEMGTDVPLSEVEKVIEKNSRNTSGVTLSGGDPFCSLDDAIALARFCKEEQHLNVICFTGFTFEELLERGKKDMRYLVLLSYIDSLVDGRFLLSLRSIAINNRGSRNQRCIDVKRSLQLDKIVLDEKMMDMSFYDDNEELF